MATKQETLVKNLDRKRKSFFNTLPTRLHCVNCDKTRLKENFGVRLMNGPEVLAGKAEPIFRVQSHCIPCRS